jgi:hypothetical protein
MFRILHKCARRGANAIGTGPSQEEPVGALTEGALSASINGPSFGSCAKSV